MSANNSRYTSPYDFNVKYGVNNTPGIAGMRESEQRLARLSAESEYKLLEEKNKAQEREHRLREDLARERGLQSKGASERTDNTTVPTQLKDRFGNQSVSSAYHAAATPSPAAPSVPTGYSGAIGGAATSTDSSILRAEIDRLNSLLSDANTQLTESEQRYQTEKRELLNYRTAQLKNETAKKGQEGDIIGRAMQVMSEYEGVIRSSEENSLARLSHHMESFEKEWIRRTREFEENKGSFESQIMEKALDALRDNNNDVEAIGNRILHKTLEVLHSQGESRLKLEEEVLAHSEAFKTQYKQILENEFRQRCRQYDDQLAEREKNLVNIIHAEREKVIEEERKAVERYEQTQMKALADAMKEISELREQLIREHQESQGKGMQELLKRRQELVNEQNVVLDQTNERISKIEAQCFEAVDAAQRSIKDMQLTMAKKEAETVEKLIMVDMERERSRVEELAKTRVEVEEQWKEAMDELRQRHSDELSHQLTTLQTRIDLIHGEQFQREQELRRNYEAKLVRIEEAADERWSKRVQETTRSLDRHLEVIQALREDNEQLSGQLTTLQEKFQLREGEVASKIFTVQREHEEVWHHKMEEMRQRYDRLLDEALGGAQGGVSVVEYNRMAGMLKIAEERIIDLKKTESETISKEREQLNEMWAERLSDERAERELWEQDQLKKLAELRIELQADSRKKETEMLCRIEQEKLKLYETHTKKILEEKRDRDAFEESLRMQCDSKIREAEEEFEEAYDSKVVFLEKRFEEKSLEMEARRKAMRKEMADFEEATKSRAADWLAKEKEDILADVREFHEKLQIEEKKLQEKALQIDRETQEKYCQMFEDSKEALRVSTAAMATLNLEHWRSCEDTWLETRSQELEILFQLKSDHAQKYLDAASFSRDAALKSSRELLEQEREELLKRETALHAEIEAIRQQSETSARERILKALEDRNMIQEESEKSRAKEEAALWEAIQLRILEKERQGERERRVLEMELRGKYETLIANERQRVDEVINLHADEQRAFAHKMDAENRKREEDWLKHRMELEAKENEQHESRYAELRKQCEDRVQWERERHERVMRERTEEFDKERQTLLDTFGKQFRDHEAAMRLQIGSLRDDYEARVKSMSQEMYQQRERFIADLGAQQVQLQGERQSYETEALNRFEKVIADLRTTLDKRAKEQQQRELEAMAAIERGKREYEERINKQYEDLLKNHQDALLKMQKERDDRAIHAEKQHQQELVKLREETEKALQSFVKSSDDRSVELASETKQQFEEKIQLHHTMLVEERNRRVEAEGRVQELTVELDVLRSGVEQHKLDVQKSLHGKYDTMFSDLKEKSRVEKEDMARAVLREEEKKLAAEISKRDNDYRLHAVRQQLQQQPVTTAANLSSADMAAVDQAKKKRERLHQLWQLLDFPHEDRNRFLEGVVGLSPRDILAALSDEVRRLELMLPLLETITRKEFVIHRLVELSKLKGKQQQVEDFAAELEKLWTKLGKDVEAYEAKHGSAFIFRGVRFLDELLTEVQGGIGGILSAANNSALSHGQSSVSPALMANLSRGLSTPAPPSQQLRY